MDDLKITCRLNENQENSGECLTNQSFSLFAHTAWDSGVPLHVLFVSDVIINPNPSIYFHPRFVYLLMITQVESKRLNYGIVLGNILLEFNNGIVFQNSLME